MTCVNRASPLGLSLENVTVSSDGKAISRGIAVGIGSPQQIVALNPTIGDDNIYLFNAADCTSATDSACIGQKGGVYNSTSSRTFRQTTEAAWNGTYQESEVETGPFIYFNDDLYFGSDGYLEGFPYFMDKPGQGNGLGLGPRSVFLDAVVNSSSAPSRNFGLWVGSRSVAEPVDGALWIGGYDTARVADTFTNFPITNDGNCVGCVVVKNLTYLTDEGPISLFSNASETLEVVLEPFTHGLEVPDHIFRNWLQATKGTVGTGQGTQLLVTVPLSAQLGNVSVTFSNGYNTIIPAHEMFIQPRHYDTSGVYDFLNDTYYISEFINTTRNKNYLPNWGTPILAMNYMVMNYDNSTFSLAPAFQGAYGGSNGALIEPLCSGVPAVSTKAGGPSGAAATTSPPTNTATTSPSSSSSHTNVGAIAGGIVGGFAGLAIITLLAFCLFRSRRRERALRQEHESVIANYDDPQNMKSQTASQINPSSPTEVSESDQKNINQWLHSQRTTMTEPSHPSSTLTQPFEMPANHREA